MRVRAGSAAAIAASIAFLLSQPATDYSFKRLTWRIAMPKNPTVRTLFSFSAVVAHLRQLFHSQRRRHVVPECKQEPPRCEKCDGEVRHLYNCCGEKLCADCYLDHASESREGVQVDPKHADLPAPLARAVSGQNTHDPPLPEATLSFLATSGPSASQLQKFFWLQHQYEKGDPRLDQAIANIDEVEFTNCQKCDGRLRRFFECEGKIFCTDCWLDHCAEIEKAAGRPTSQ
jgi:hypothetical protein